MKVKLGFFLVALSFVSCHKVHTSTRSEKPGEGGSSSLKVCDIQRTYADNRKKVTITNGVWGTVSSVEGNCMPSVPACSSCCSNCPVKRTVKIYEYTTLNDAVTSDPYKIFFDSFYTQLVKEVNTDDDGFFQAEIPSGSYSIFVVENGKLYASTGDGQGGLSPFKFSGGIQNINLTMTYKAVF